MKVSSIFGKKGFGKGSPRSPALRGATLVKMRQKARSHETGGRSGISPAAPKKFGRAVPLQIGGAHPRAPSPRRWGKQKGRTLLEMLGVLAIVGILSIAALVGFTYAMNKHRANETIYDVMLRGTNVPMVDENYASKPSSHVVNSSFCCVQWWDGIYRRWGYVLYE